MTADGMPEIHQVHGVMAEFASAAALVAAARRPARPATGSWMPTRRFRWKNLRTRWSCRLRAFPGHVRRRHRGRGGGPRDAVLRQPVSRTR